MLALLKSGPLVAIVAHGLIGISLVWDKVLLKQRGTQNLVSYVFWLGAMSALGVVLVPFGYQQPSLTVMWVAFVAGVAHMAGISFYYLALKRGEASETLAVVGGFSPAATAALSYVLLSKQMTGPQLLGFALMTGGGFGMFFSEHLRLKRLLTPVLFAAGLLGLVNVLQKIAFDDTNFVTGYVWFTIGTFAGSLSLLVRRSWRRQILTHSRDAEPRSRFWYFVNRFVSGVGSFLIFYAISLSHPAIVDAISGVRYAIIFVGALLLTRFKPQWLKERFRGAELVTKALATAAVVAGLVLVALAGTAGSAAARQDREPVMNLEVAQACSVSRVLPAPLCWPGQVWRAYAYPTHPPALPTSLRSSSDQLPQTSVIGKRRRPLTASSAIARRTRP